MPLVRSDQYAEIEAADALHQLGFQVEMLGGQFKMSDGTALRTNLSLDVQVKGTSKATPWIDWRKPGEPAREYARWAQAMGRTAVFLFVHAIQVKEAYLKDGEIRFPRPEVNIYAVSESDFADDVDESRRQYASEPYLRGEKKGQLKPESGLAFPVCADEYLSLSAYIDNLSRLHAQ